MTFRSILFRDVTLRGPRETVSAPEFFGDLNLDQIVGAITTGKDEYKLRSFFYTPLGDVDAIAFRHEVFQDLEDARLFRNIKSFADHMRAVRGHLAQAEKIRHPHQKKRWFLDAVHVYCDAVTRLAAGLTAGNLGSRGLRRSGNI